MPLPKILNLTRFPFPFLKMTRQHLYCKDVLLNMVAMVTTMSMIIITMVVHNLLIPPGALVANVNLYPETP